VSCASQPTTPNIPINTLEIINSPQPSSTLTATPIFTPTQTPTPFESVLLGTPLPLVSSIVSPDNASQVIQLARWGDGIIWRALVSPNGKSVVLISSIGFYLYNSKTFEMIRFIETDSDIGGVAISPDSQILAIGTRERMLVYSLNDGALITTIDKSATNLAFSPDGQKIAIGAGDWDMCRKEGSLELWQVSDWSLLQILPLTNELDCIGDLVFSPSGKFLAASAFEVLVWEIGENSSTLKVQSWGCDIFEGSVAFTPDDKTLVIGQQADSGRDEICLMRLADGEVLGALDKANKSNYSCGSQVLISPDGQLMASNLDGKVTIWQTGFWKQIHSLDVEGSCAQLSGWLPDGKTLMFLLPDSSLQFLDSQTGKIIRSVNLRKPSNPVNTVAWSPDGETIAVGDEEGIAHIFNAQNGIVVNGFGSGYELNSIAFAPDSLTLALGYGDRTAQIWNLDGNLQQIIEGFGYGSSDVTFTSDGKLFAAILPESWQTPPQVRIWNTSNWSVEKVFPVGDRDNYMITGFALAPDQNTGAISYVDMHGYHTDFIKIISIHDGTELANIEPKRNQYRVFIDAIVYSPDNSMLAALVSEFDDPNPRILVWQTSDWSLLYQITINSGPRLGLSKNQRDALTWSPDGRLIVVGVKDGSIQIFKAINGENLATLHGHTMWVTGVAFSPDGKMLVSSSIDGTIRIWGIAP